MSQTTRLTVPEVQTALRLTGLPPGPTSPFAQLTPPATIEQAVVASLRAKGVLNGNGGPTPAWTGALQTLTEPSHRVALFLASPERWLETSYYSSGGGLVGFAGHVEDCGVTFPYDAAEVEALLAEWMGWHAPPPASPLSATLQGAEVTAFAAVVDAFREETLRAYLERRPPEPERFSRDHLARQLAFVDTPDSRWLCPILKRHAPAPLQPGEQALNTGARSMAARGLLRFEGEAVVLEGALFDVCAGMANVAPYAHVAVQHAGGSTSALYLTGVRRFWAIDFPAGADGQPLCRFQALGGEEAAAHAHRQFQTLPAPRPAATNWTVATAAAPVPVAAPEPARVQPPTPRPTQPIPRPCAKCGKPLKPGKKFCGSCGAPV